jgi:hypothetical protein
MPGVGARSASGSTSATTSAPRYLRCRDPVTGLNYHPQVLAFHRLVFNTPSLAGRLTRYMIEDEQALADSLGTGIQARLLAAHVLAAQRVLARTNWHKLAGGRTADDVYTEAVADADHAFAQLPTQAPPPTAHSDRPDAGPPRPAGSRSCLRQMG